MILKSKSSAHLKEQIQRQETIALTESIMAKSSKSNKPAAAETNNKPAAAAAEEAPKGAKGKAANTAETGVLAYVPTDKVDSTPNREEDGADAESYATLLRSVKAKGVLQPIRLSAKEDGRFAIIAGRRRLRACIEAKIAHIPAIIVKTDGADVEAFVENVVRKNLTPYESCMACKAMSDSGLSGVSIAKETGLSSASVNNYIRVATKCSAKVLEALKEGKIGLATAIAYAGEEDHAKQDDLLAKGEKPARAPRAASANSETPEGAEDAASWKQDVDGWLAARAASFDDADAAAAIKGIADAMKAAKQPQPTILAAIENLLRVILDFSDEVTEEDAGELPPPPPQRPA